MVTALILASFAVKESSKLHSHVTEHVTERIDKVITALSMVCDLTAEPVDAPTLIKLFLTYL